MKKLNKSCRQPTFSSEKLNAKKDLAMAIVSFLGILVCLVFLF